MKAHPHGMRLFIIDEQEIFRIGLQTALETHSQFDIIGTAASLDQARVQTAHLQPDLVVIDIFVRKTPHLDICRDILARCPSTKILILTHLTDLAIIRSALLMGVAGYLFKNVRGRSLIHSLHLINKGQTVVAPHITQVFSRDLSTISSSLYTSKPTDILSPQEHAILALIAEGQTNKQVAEHLGVSQQEIRRNLRKIYQQLGVSRRSQASAMFAKGLIKEGTL